MALHEVFVRAGGKIMVLKCKMEAAVGSGYRVVAGWSLELALPPPLRTEVGRRRGAAWSWLLRWGKTKVPLPPAASSWRS